MVFNWNNSTIMQAASLIFDVSETSCWFFFKAYKNLNKKPQILPKNGARGLKT